MSPDGNREGRIPLPSVDQALAMVLGRVVARSPRAHVLADALGLVLARDALADLDMPPFDKALVDGYAARSSDLEAGDRRLVLGELLPAGATPSRGLGDREAAVIMTGAPLPLGADVVVMHERTHRSGDFVVIDEPSIKPGQNILRRGREARAGDVVVERGRELTPARLGVLASFGCPRVMATPRPEVVVVPTGDELVEPDSAPGPGQIRNSGSTMLTALAVQAGARARALEIAPDRPEALRAALERGLDADLLIVTGGVSAGQRDLVPASLEALGVECVFHKVRIKPGKPIWFGVARPRGDRPGTLVFGLPGNPVGSLVGFLVFARPALWLLAGRPGNAFARSSARLEGPFSHRGDRPTYFPAVLTTTSTPPVARPLEWAGSADLRRAAEADGFLAFEAGDRDYAAGEIVPFLPMG